MGLLGDFVKRQWERGDREALQEQVQSLIGQAPSPQFKQMSEQGVPVEEYIASKRPMDVRAGTGALESGQLDVQKLAQGLIGVPETQGIGAQLIRDLMPSPTKPTGLMQNLAMAGVDFNTPEGKKIMLDAVMKPSTQVNLNQTKPLGAGAANWMNAAGQSPDPRLSVSEASAQGFRPTTAATRKDILSAGASVAPLGEMIKWGFGEEGKGGLFPSDKEGLIGRTGGGISSFIAGKGETDKATSLYNASQNALVTSLARLVGQVGTLTDRDVDTVRDLFPRAGFTPVSIAKAKFQSIATLLVGKGVPKKQLEDMGFPKWAFGEPDTGGGSDDKIVDFGDLQ